MVDSLTGPGGQEENQSTESTPKKESALQKHLRRLGIFGEAKKDSIESDDDEESDKPKKKFRKFFKGLFKDIVEPPQSQDSKTAKRPNLESLFFGWQEPEVKNSPNDESEETKTEAQEAETPAQQEIVSEKAPETSEPLDETNTHLETSEDVLIEEVPTLAANEGIAAPVQPDAAREFTTNPIIFERSTTNTPEKETVVERGTGMALPVVLVGAEYLARKRADRKLDTKFSEKTETLEKTVKQSDMAREQLDKLVRQNKEQLEKLKRERIPALENLPALKVEKQPKPEQLARTEVPKLQTRVEHAETTIQEQEVAKREQYKIMEQVANAAEHDVPVEIAFERSHEVKDDLSSPTAAASIGAIMAAQAEEQRRTARSQTVARRNLEDVSGLPFVNKPQTPDMYQQAMKRGFWAAVCIIILGMIAYLVK